MQYDSESKIEGRVCEMEFTERETACERPIWHE